LSEALYELTMFGDLRKVRERAGYLEKTDPGYRAFARGIRELAERFEDEPILALLEEHMKPEDN
jgi:hypothetical protein